MEKNSKSIDISMPSTTEKPYSGMSKDELERFAQTPFWVRTRWILFILFWLIWIGLLAGAVAIIATTPQCESRVEKWWRSSVIYQIYPRSYQDTDNDGNGDLKGIESRLEYVKNLGIGAIWFNPIYLSPEKDNGYDVEDYEQINPIYGTMEDMDRLIAEIHDHGMKVIMDFIPNHTSDKSKWFEASKENKNDDNVYRDYYVWRENGTNSGPPNNWMSVFGGPAWTYMASRDQWYLHQYRMEQPDLNPREPKVHEELLNVLKFWLNKEVDGFRIDAIKRMYEHESYADEVPSGLTDDPANFDYLFHNLTINQPETYEIVKEWSDFIKSYGQDKVVITEATGIDVLLAQKYYSYGSDIPYNFELVKMVDDEKCSNIARCVSDAVTSWMDNMPPGELPNWVVGTHDNKRIASRIGGVFVNVINMLLLLLPGTPTIYYGEEIGMRDNEQLYPADPLEVFNRSYCRTPMQWNAELYAGFSNNTPWLPVTSDYTTRNVQVQDVVDDKYTNINLFKNLMELRKKTSFLEGESHFSNSSGEGLFAFTRKSEGESGYLVILHFGTATVSYDPTPLQVNSGEIVLSTKNIDLTADTTDLMNNQLSLRSGEGVVLKYD